MINITSTDLRKLEKIGSGKYGIVYYVNDSIAYKIYHEFTKDREGFHEKNPALSHIKRRIERLKRKESNLQYTDIPKDYIILNGRIGGIIIPYYNGCVLNKLTERNYQLKKKITNQLFLSHQELINNHIYPTDYHNGNIMVTNETPKIIDLDDPLTHTTHIPNALLNFVSTSRLNEVICSLFNEYEYKYYEELYYLIDRQKITPTHNNKWIQDLYQEREQIKDYLIITEQTNIPIIKYILEKKQVRIVLKTTKNKIYDYSILDDLYRFKQEGIPIYDIIEDDIDKYFENFPAKEKLYLK